MIEILKNFGLPVALVAAFLWFFYKRLWPDMIQQRAAWQREAEGATAALGKLDNVITRQNQINLEILQELRELNRKRREHGRVRQSLISP